MFLHPHGKAKKVLFKNGSAGTNCFRNVCIVLLLKSLSKGAFLEQLCSGNLPTVPKFPWALCWPELPFSSPSLFEATALTVEGIPGLPFSPHFLVKGWLQSWAQQLTNHNMNVSRKKLSSFVTSPANKYVPGAAKQQMQYLGFSSPLLPWMCHYIQSAVLKYAYKH